MDRAQFERMLVRQTSRRRLLIGGTAAAAGLAVTASFRGAPTRPAPILAAQSSPSASPFASPVATPVASPVASTFEGYPFSLGVASGDPLPDGVVLWTRLAPDPTADDGLGGLSGQPALEVAWEISSTDTFDNGNIVQRGTAIASPDLAYSVHADVSGLEPEREYFYRFIAGGIESPIGRTRTAPIAGAPVSSLRFGFASCSMWEHGYFNAYRDMAQSDLDLILHLGDYIYEYEATGYAIDGGPVRTVTGPETANLLDYRNRHALYKTDPDLQAAHAAAPWIVTWDDHETENDYAAAMSENGDPVDRFLLRRANAYQAYYEHLPLRPESMPQGPDMQLYRRLGWGGLAEFQVLDTRQYRSDQPCGDGVQVRCPAALDPATTMLGPDQERWLLEGLDASTVTWNVLAQQLMMARMEQLEGPGEKFWGDGWDMYTAARTRILSHVMSRGIPNTVVITGDIHTAWANDLKGDFEDVESPAIASEYICTSVSAGGDSSDTETFTPYLAENPHIKYFDGTHGGYTRVELTPDRWQAEFRTVTDLRDPASGLETIATYVTESGNPGVQPA